MIAGVACVARRAETVAAAFARCHVANWRFVADARTTGDGQTVIFVKLFNKFGFNDEQHAVSSNNRRSALLVKNMA